MKIDFQWVLIHQWDVVNPICFRGQIIFYIIYDSFKNYFHAINTDLCKPQFFLKKTIFNAWRNPKILSHRLWSKRLSAYLVCFWNLSQYCIIKYFTFRKIWIKFLNYSLSFGKKRLTMWIKYISISSWSSKGIKIHPYIDLISNSQRWLENVEIISILMIIQS